MTLLVVTVTDGQTRQSHTYALRSSPTVIGHAADADLRIARRFIGERCLRVDFANDRISILPLDAATGVTHEGSPLPLDVATELPPGAEVVLAGRLRVQFLQPGADTRTPDLGAEDPFAAFPESPAGTAGHTAPTAANGGTGIIQIMGLAVTTPFRRPQLPDETRSKSPRTPTGRLVSGNKLGRYEIRGEIGAGGMGIVYRAHDGRLQRDVAIKTISPGFRVAGDALARFEREALAVSNVDHPNVVRVFDFGVQDERPYIVMELLRGQDMATLMEHGPLAVERAVDILLGVSAGMSACHGRGIVHRDLKPRNVFLAQTLVGEVAKVVDFGVSQLPGTEHLTGPSDVIGTVGYMSPEQAGGQDVDARSDQYALGVILYQCLTGRRPHEGSNPVRVMASIMTGSFARPTSHRADLPEELEALIIRAMGKLPQDRFPSVHEYGRALLPFASARGHQQWTHHFTAPPAKSAMIPSTVERAAAHEDRPAGANPAAAGTAIMPSDDAARAQPTHTHARPTVNNDATPMTGSSVRTGRAPAFGMNRRLAVGAVAAVAMVVAVVLVTRPSRNQRPTESTARSLATPQGQAPPLMPAPTPTPTTEPAQAPVAEASAATTAPKSTPKKSPAKKHGKSDLKPTPGGAPIIP